MKVQKFFRKILGMVCLGLFVLTAVIFAQDKKEYQVALGNNLYCAGFVQTGPVNTGNKIVGAEDEQEQYIYSQGDNVYINMGANKGVQVGDMFAVIRPRGTVNSRWTKKSNLGFYVQEVGALEVVNVKNEVSVARVKSSCDNLLLGDLLQPIQSRTSPMFKQRPALDVFANPSGKSTGRIFMARDNREMLGTEQIVYIDLGAEDNVQVGDYLTIFRPLGKGNLFMPNENEAFEARNENYQSDKYRGGKFSNQAARKKGDQAQGKVVSNGEAKEDRPSDLRKVVGEVIVLSVKEKTATVLIVRAAQEIHTGDWVELQ